MEIELCAAKVHEIINDAIKLINTNMLGSCLLSDFPMRKTSDTVYPDVNAVLKEHGSPACTDGKAVYIEPTILGDMLMRKYNALDTKGMSIVTREDYWRAPVSDKELPPMCYPEMVRETMSVLLHELTHAFNNHSKLGIAAEKDGNIDMRRFNIACELQANDGIMGVTYELSRFQTLQGVTNKRLHPETIGKHTLKGLYDAIKLNEQEQQGMSNANAKAELRKKVGKATGQYDKDVQEVAEEQEKNRKKQEKSKEENKQETQTSCKTKQDNADEDDNSKVWSVGEGGNIEYTSDEKLINEIKKRGLQKVKELILSSLSEELRYDATTDSVIFDRVYKRHSHATYARPSRRIGAMGMGGNQLLRKGVKYTRDYEYNKSRKLTVLAVDGSGSMTGQQRYVSAILDDLLRQVEAIAKEYKVEVHYENLQATIHRTACTQFVPANSAEWRERMRTYRAGGGNKFMAVLESTNKLLKNADYDAISIINLSDGLDRLDDEDIMQTAIGRYISNDKVKWVDAIIAHDTNWLNEAIHMAKDDAIKIREQVVIAGNLDK